MTKKHEEVEQSEVVEEVQELVEGGEVTEEAAGETAKRPKKLQKAIDGTQVVITVIGGAQGEMRFDAAELSPEIQQKLIPFGLSHKLGDAAAGRSGKDAEEAIAKVWEGIKEGNWSVRAPAAAKVSIADVKNNLANLSPEEQEKAKALLASLGLNV